MSANTKSTTEGLTSRTKIDGGHTTTTSNHKSKEKTAFSKP